MTRDNTDMDMAVSLFDVEDSKTFGKVADMTVSRIGTRDVDEFCRRYHYAKTGGNMSWSYGMWDGFILVGVVSYNLPTMQACSAFFGADRWDWVVHMGRLVCADDAPRNCESRLISQSLKLLQIDRPVVRAVVTYAAIGQGHVGYVYQATNALYLGLTAPANFYMDQEGRRRATKQGKSVSTAKAIDRGWSVHLDPPKHRYAYLLGNKTQRKEARELLQFPVMDYPKGDQHAV